MWQQRNLIGPPAKVIPHRPGVGQRALPMLLTLGEGRLVEQVPECRA